MKQHIVDNKYHEGQEVFATNAPSVRLVVRRYVDRIYYCSFLDYPARNDLALFERELVARK
jgi:hypothetical protein